MKKHLKRLNTNFSSPKERVLEFLLIEDQNSVANWGEVTYCFSCLKLQEVLNDNDFDQYFKEETQDVVNDLLIRHIINQLSSSLGSL